MKELRQFSILAGLFAIALTGCKKDIPASLSLLTSNISVEAAGGSQDVSFLTNQSWSVRSSENWVTVAPASGGASDVYQAVTVTVAENPDESSRTATLSLTAGEKSGQITVTQAGMPRFTIRDFLAKKADKTTWYKLTGEIASLPEKNYGNFYLVDDTGLVLVYGLTEKQTTANDQSFSKLGLKPGDTVTIMTLRSEYNGNAEAGGTIPAYFVSKTAGEYKLGKKVASTKAGWLELPATSSTDKQDLLIHYFLDGKRSYAAYYDYTNLVSTWVAYPLCSGYIDSGSRSVGSHFPMDPLLTQEQQPYLAYGYKYAAGDDPLDRGHQIPSADRGAWRVNMETFFSTNITPQNSDFNAGTWAALETRVRGWASRSDTLYVVTGCYGADKAVHSATDTESKKVGVPTGYYKAILRLASDKYSAVAFWFDNKANAATSIQKSMAMSVDELEKKVGVDFFVNLPEETQKTVEAQNPAEEAWWWNN